MQEHYRTALKRHSKQFSASSESWVQFTQKVYFLLHPPVLVSFGQMAQHLDIVSSQLLNVFRCLIIRAFRRSGCGWGSGGFHFFPPFRFQRPARSAILTRTFSGSSSNFWMLTGGRYISWVSVKIRYFGHFDKIFVKALQRRATDLFVTSKNKSYISYKSYPESFNFGMVRYCRRGLFEFFTLQCFM